MQKDIAGEIGATRASLRNWELNRSAPALRFLPGIIRFLGYVPFTLGESLPERLVTAGRALATSRERFARLLGVDESTVYREERAHHEPRSASRRKAQNVLASLAPNSMSVLKRSC